MDVGTIHIHTNGERVEIVKDLEHNTLDILVWKSKHEWDYDRIILWGEDSTNFPEVTFKTRPAATEDNEIPAAIEDADPFVATDHEQR